MIVGRLRQLPSIKDTLPLQPDQQIAHYGTVEKIGEGGMGKV